MAAVVLVNVGTGLPSKQVALVPNPTRSETPLFGNGHEVPPMLVPGLVMATLPVRPRLMMLN